MENKYSFIGAGNMGTAVAKAVAKAEKGENVLLYRRSYEKLLEIGQELSCNIAKSAEEAVLFGKFIVLGVKPKDFINVLNSLIPSIKKGLEMGKEFVLVSIAAGLEMKKMEEALLKEGLELPIIRLMPNTPVSIGRGTTLIASNELCKKEDVEALSKGLKFGGDVLFVEENMIDAMTPVFSCSPAFVYMFIDALADGAVMAGVRRDDAIKLAAQTVLGSAAMVLETKKHPAQLKDEVCSPKGSTIEGVATLEQGAFRGTVAKAVYDAYLKTTKLGK